jgi:hypothetical protein
VPYFLLAGYSKKTCFTPSNGFGRQFGPSSKA